MRNVQAWFDIWGSMQGSTNDAMATGSRLSVRYSYEIIHGFELL